MKTEVKDRGLILEYLLIEIRSGKAEIERRWSIEGGEH